METITCMSIGFLFVLVFAYILGYGAGVNKLEKEKERLLKKIDDAEFEMKKQMHLVEWYCTKLHNLQKQIDHATEEST